MSSKNSVGDSGKIEDGSLDGRNTLDTPMQAVRMQPPLRSGDLSGGETGIISGNQISIDRNSKVSSISLIFHTVTGYLGNLFNQN